MRVPEPPPPPFSLQCTKARLKVTEKELKSLRWEHEVLEQRFTKVSARDARGPGRAPSSSSWSSRCPPRSARLAVDGPGLRGQFLVGSGLCPLLSPGALL